MKYIIFYGVFLVQISIGVLLIVPVYSENILDMKQNLIRNIVTMAGNISDDFSLGEQITSTTIATLMMRLAPPERLFAKIICIFICLLTYVLYTNIEINYSIGKGGAILSRMYDDPSLPYHVLLAFVSFVRIMSAIIIVVTICRK